MMRVMRVISATAGFKYFSTTMVRLCWPPQRTRARPLPCMVVLVAVAVYGDQASTGAAGKLNVKDRPPTLEHSVIIFRLAHTLLLVVVSFRFGEP